MINSDEFFFLSWFLNVVTRHFRISRGECLLLDRNPKGYEVAEHIAIKVEVRVRTWPPVCRVCPNYEVVVF